MAKELFTVVHHSCTACGLVACCRTYLPQEGNMMERSKHQQGIFVAAGRKALDTIMIPRKNRRLVLSLAMLMVMAVGQVLVAFQQQPSMLASSYDSSTISEWMLTTTTIGEDSTAAAETGDTGGGQRFFHRDLDLLLSGKWPLATSSSPRRRSLLSAAALGRTTTTTNASTVTCSCWNPHALWHCCHRLVTTTHKFGVMFKDSVFGNIPGFDVVSRGGGEEKAAADRQTTTWAAQAQRREEEQSRRERRSDAQLHGGVDDSDANDKVAARRRRAEDERYYQLNQQLEENARRRAEFHVESYFADEKRRRRQRQRQALTTQRRTSKQQAKGDDAVDDSVDDDDDDDDGDDNKSNEEKQTSRHEVLTTRRGAERVKRKAAKEEGDDDDAFDDSIDDDGDDTSDDEKQTRRRAPSLAVGDQDTTATADDSSKDGDDDDDDDTAADDDDDSKSRGETNRLHNGGVIDGGPAKSAKKQERRRQSANDDDDVKDDSKTQDDDDDDYDDDSESRDRLSKRGTRIEGTDGSKAKRAPNDEDDDDDADEVDDDDDGEIILGDDDDDVDAEVNDDDVDAKVTEERIGRKEAAMKMILRERYQEGLQSMPELARMSISEQEEYLMQMLRAGRGGDRRRWRHGMGDPDSLLLASAREKMLEGRDGRRHRNRLMARNATLFHDNWLKHRQQQPTQNNNNNTTTDYRYFVILRNMFKAIVSGYLYHKAGHECHLDQLGRVRRKTGGVPLNRQAYWTKFIKTLPQDSYPPAKPRESLCRYLERQSVEDGMRVYLDVAMHMWYSTVESFVMEMDRRRKEHGDYRSLVICLEDAMQVMQNPEQRSSFLRNTAEFLYPPTHHKVDGGGNQVRQALVSRFNITRFDEQKGKHGTLNVSSVEKVKLNKLARKLDKKHFKGRLHALEKLIRC